nr:VanW family protein [Mobiluncus mulieris]
MTKAPRKPTLRKLEPGKSAPRKPEPRKSAPRKPIPRDANATEVFAGFAQDRKRTGRFPATLGLIIGLVVLVYVGTGIALSGAVPKGASFAGVAVGGMPTDQAIKKLETELGPRLKAPLKVKLGEKTAPLDPVAAGLTPDFAASINQLTRFTLNPLTIMSRLTGVGEQTLKTQVDQRLLDQAVAKVAPLLRMAPREATFQCVDAKLHPVKPQPGYDLNLAEASASIAAKWWRGEPLSLSGTTIAPKSTIAQLDQAAAGPAKTLMSRPVKANVGGKTLEIPTGELCRVASWKLGGKKLAVTLDGAKLRDYVMSRVSGLETNPVDARFEFVNGAPQVVPSINGTKLEAGEVASKIQAGAISPENREVSVDLQPIAPKFTTEDATQAGIKEVIGEFDTPVTAVAKRTGNLRQGAAKITGVMVRPGEEFSLEKVLGPITAENGWSASGVINNGVHTTAVGGGLSQLCATTLNAAWFAGMDLIEFHPHSVWFSRYPAGRECTLWEGSLDLRWRNPNPKPVLLRGWVGAERLHVQMWGTKYFEVKSTQSERSGVRAPGKKVNTWSGCVPSGSGHSGFTISNTRVRLLDGKEHDSKTYTHTYQPDDQIVCAKDGKDGKDAKAKSASRGASGVKPPTNPKAVD